MESASTPEALIRPWRTAALAACAVAAAELVLLLAIAVIVFGRPLLDRAQASERHRAVAARGHPKDKPARAAAPAPRKERLPTPRLTRAQTSVIVLNGNGIAGAAAAEAASVRAHGYKVRTVGNARRSDWRGSVAVYRPGFKPEARRLARDLRVGRVSPLDGMRRGELMGAHVALIVG